jgi:hypothetical protein
MHCLLVTSLSIDHIKFFLVSSSQSRCARAISNQKIQLHSPRPSVLVLLVVVLFVSCVCVWIVIKAAVYFLFAIATNPFHCSSNTRLQNRPENGKCCVWKNESEPEPAREKRTGNERERERDKTIYPLCVVLLGLYRTRRGYNNNSPCRNPHQPLLFSIHVRVRRPLFPIRKTAHEINYR